LKARDGDILRVPRDKREVLIEGRGRQQTVDHRERRFGRRRSGGDSAPTVRHRVIDRQNPFRKAQDEIAVQPRLERDAARGIAKRRDALADFAEREDTQVQQILVNGIDPDHHLGLGLGLDQLGGAVGVQQEATHSSTSRP
jgi:hypothetical protein